MKQFLSFGFISSIAFSSSLFALNPIPGAYGGMMAQVSRGPSTRPIDFNHDNLSFLGTVNYSQLGGGGGAFVGYRIQNVRLEGEILYNRVSYSSLKIGSCTLQSPTVETPTGHCPQDHFQQDRVGFNGSTATLYGLFNGYYDFFSYGSENTVIPYLGLGIGQARIKNSSNFVNTTTQASRGGSSTISSLAAQGILGVSFYIDDYTWAGIDYRYLTTNGLTDFGNGRYGISTLNFNINFSFGSG